MTESEAGDPVEATVHNAVAVIPTYNESNNIQALVEELLNLPVELSVLIVDDNSPDGTGQLADELARRHPGRVNVLHRPGKGGLGTAYIAGFRWAIKHGAQHIIQMDADFSHRPSYIPEMLRLARQYDVVVGSRYIKGSQLDPRWGWGRKLLSWWANAIWVRALIRTKTFDATAGFKCWRRSSLIAIDMDTIRSNGYVFQVEMCYAAEKSGLRIVEMPIFFEDRRIGQSKMSIRVKFEAAWRVFQITRQRRTQVHPVMHAISTHEPQSS